MEVPSAHGMTTNLRSRSRGAAGFTIAELMITLTVLAITLLWVTPSLMRVVRKGNTTQVMDQMVGDINNARMLAIRKGRTASLTVLSTGQGYNLVVGTDTMRRFRMNNRESTVRFSPVSTSVTFNNRGMITSAGSQQVLYAIQGTDSAKVTITGIGGIYRDY
jgi:prepilin-type N-terminal cleavage/methylation domain-containing protein